LVWAYREELPKDPRRAGAPALPASAWHGVSRYSEVLANVDFSDNRYGVAPFAAASGWPHPDAIALHEAVLGLDALDLGWPDGWNILANLDVGPDGSAACALALERLCLIEAGGRRVWRQSPAVLARRSAVLGPPDWRHDPPRRREVTHLDGRSRWFRRVTIAAGPGGHPYEIEVDGWCPTRRRPHADAYRKFVWEPDLTVIALDRAAYEIWHAALGALVEDLAGKLAEIDVTPSPRPARPWETGEAAATVWRYDPPAPAAIPRRKGRRRVRAA
jgi:hypothetical protein